jgi:hypothetical protein
MLLIVAEGRTAHLAQVSDGALSLIAGLRLEYPLAWARWRDRIVYVDAERGRLCELDAQGRTSVRMWGLPDSLSIDHVAVVGDRAYIAGVMAGERQPELLTCVLDGSPAHWTSVYPHELERRRHIDALLVREGALIVVDDLVLPKFLFVFDDAEHSPDESRIVCLPSHGTYERVGAAACAGSHIVLLSGSGGELGNCIHLFALPVTDLDHGVETGSVTAFRPRQRNSEIEQRVHLPGTALFHAGRMAAVGEHVAIACGEHGLLLVRPDRLDSCCDMIIGDAEPAKLRSIMCLLGPAQLPTHRATDSELPPRAWQVIDVLEGGHDGCAVVLRMDDWSLRSIFLPYVLFTALLS